MINLLFGVHNHQPVGNFESVFKRANQDCYRPFIELLANFPDIKFTLHLSGSLIDWLLKNDPGFLEKVKVLLRRNQVEILTGAYYEPILPIIPGEDISGQINMLSNFIRDYFKYEPKGMWIGERVWEPWLIEVLVKAGIKYILLDDFHFFRAGKKGDLSGYYLSEYQGYSLAVFPINKRLRYIIPFSSPEQPLNYLRGLATGEADASATIVDDGEKFGLWPGTHQWVYHQGWLRNFFRLLIKNQSWLRTMTLSEYMQKYKSSGRCYIPAGSYEEMMEWSGGSFENFFFKYPEANNLHKRMLYVSERLNKVLDNSKKEAIRYLYMSQCNCPYWHGVFGGIYLGHLRHLAYKNLITAQSIIEKKKGHGWIEMETLDFDRDGSDELIIKNPVLNIFISPRLGGGIFELDYIPGRVNLMNGMTRRPESYHQNIKADKGRWSLFKKKEKITSIHDLLGPKEEGLKNYLTYDSYRRLSLLDHFFSQDLTFQDFRACRYRELGDFVATPYSVREKRFIRTATLLLQREGRIDYNTEKRPLLLIKELSISDSEAELSIEYYLKNLGNTPLKFIFGVEFNISPEGFRSNNNLCLREKSRENIYSLREDIEAKDVEELHLKDEINGVKFSLYFGKTAHIWSYPLETVSASEQGFERNYQQTVILSCWPIRLENDWKAQFSCNLSNI